MTIQEIKKHFEITSSFTKTEFASLGGYKILIEVKHRTLPFTMEFSFEWSAKYPLIGGYYDPVKETINLYESMIGEITKMKCFGEASVIVTSKEVRYSLEWDNENESWFTLDKEGNKFYGENVHLLPPVFG